MVGSCRYANCIPERRLKMRFTEISRPLLHSGLYLITNTCNSEDSDSPLAQAVRTLPRYNTLKLGSYSVMVTDRRRQSLPRPSLTLRRARSLKSLASITSYFYEDRAQTGRCSPPLHRLPPAPSIALFTFTCPIQSFILFLTVFLPHCPW